MPQSEGTMERGAKKLYGIYEDLSLSVLINMQRIQWYDHVRRMGEDQQDRFSRDSGKKAKSSLRTE